MSRLHKHGFDFTRQYKAPEQLSELLEMDIDSPEFQRIKVHLLYLTLKHLDPNLNGRKQKKTLVRVEELLKKDLPNVFGGPKNISAKRLYFATRVMLYLHRRRSRTSTSNKENRDTGPVLEAAPDITLDLTNDCTDSEAEDRRDGSIKKRSPSSQLDLSLARHSLPNIEQKRERSSVPSHVVPSTQILPDVMKLDRDPSPINNSAGQALIRAASSSCSPWESDQSTSALNSFGPDPSSYNPSRLSIKKREVKRIRSFLSSCSPPLGHLLSRFIDIGFTSTAILSEVASNWTKNERMEFLKELPLGPDGESVTQLELMALERRFQRYDSMPRKELQS